ncbi:MAG: hypothetical protein IPI30_08965 [Saprospiraceae bacterium]|nr:hypothetical protein [Candidatus Vicinibacter affinis]
MKNSLVQDNTSAPQLSVKKIQNPVEQLYETLGAGTRNFLFTNADAASNYGIELKSI